MVFTAASLVFAIAPVTGARAQTAPAAAPAAATTESIVVTGSRIKRTNATSDAPVSIISAEDIKHSGAQTIEDVLQRIPSIGTGGLYSTTNNGGEGASCTDLRNLGVNRTLVLVNGKRFVQTGSQVSSCVDLNNIPLALVDHIDVLKDGASTIYGADAVAGVINVILKKNFTGTLVNVTGGMAGQGDRKTGTIDVTTGANFDKGNFTLSGGYNSIGEIAQADRSWANPVRTDNVRLHRTYVRTGSGIPLGGRIFDGPNTDCGSTDTAFYSNNCQGYNTLALGNGATKDFSNKTDRFNWGDRTWLAGAQVKYNFDGSVNYEITDDMQFYANGYYNHNHTEQQLAPDPVTNSASGGQGTPDLLVPAGNPFLTQLGITEDVALYKRLNEFGNRHYSQDTNTFQGTGGLKGSLRDGWDYDVFFNYGSSEKTETETNVVNYVRLEQELGIRQTYNLAPYFANGDLIPASQQDPANVANFGPYATGVVGDAVVYDPTVCTNSPGCVLANPFGQHGLSQAAVNYARVNTHVSTAFSMRQFGGSLTNNDVFDLPYGPLGLSMGVENRHEQGEYVPDPLVLGGYTTDSINQPTKGGFSVTELYTEASIPLLSNLPFVKDLSINASGRYFDYDTFGPGAVWKFEADYSPTQDIKFRGSLGTGFRQPAVYELYGGQYVSYNGISDPCATSSSSGGNLAANCAKVGATDTTSTNGQVQTVQGGNPNLQPETSQSWGFGTVITPRWTPRLAITVDYWKYKIQQTINAVQSQTILDECYNSLNFSSSFCSQVSPRDGLHQLTLVTALNQNLGVTKTDGIDINFDYSIPLGSMGTIALRDDFQNLISYKSQDFTNGPFHEYAGYLIVPQPGNYGYARNKNNTFIDWTYGDLGFGYRTRYIGGMGYYQVDPTGVALRAPAILYHDISASYKWRNIDTTFGIDNLFDKSPPLANDGVTNTNTNVYDVVGRFFYIKAAMKF